MGSMLVYPENEEDGDLCTAACVCACPRFGTIHRPASRRFWSYDARLRKIGRPRLLA
jgi:hypothetical protein